MKELIFAAAIALTPWADDPDTGQECRWVELHNKAFKQCRMSHTRPKVYWLCVAQRLEGMEGNRWHYYCNGESINAEEFDKSIEDKHEAKDESNIKYHHC